MKEGLQVGLTSVKLSTAQMIRALGQNEKLDRAELEKAMSSLVEQLDETANLANLHRLNFFDKSICQHSNSTFTAPSPLTTASRTR